MGASMSELVFQVPEASYDKELDGLLWIRNPFEFDRELPALYYTWTGPDDQQACYTLLYCGSNVEDLGLLRKWLSILRDALHVNVFCCEYIGYGLSEGEPSEQSCYDSLYAGYHYLTKTLQIPPEHIILMGKSMGTGPVVELAAMLAEGEDRRKKTNTSRIYRSGSGHKAGGAHIRSPDGQIPKTEVAAMILQSPILSVLRTQQSPNQVAANSPIRSRIRSITSSVISSDMFENYKKLPRIKCPMLLVHGREDDFVPYEQVKKLARLNPHVWKLLLIDEAHHYDLEYHYSDELLDCMLDFLTILNPESSFEKPGFLIPDEYITPETTVSKWLEASGHSDELLPYVQKFIEAGYFDEYVLASLDELDLSAIGIEDDSHRQYILDYVQNLKEGPGDCGRSVAAQVKEFCDSAPKLAMDSPQHQTSNWKQNVTLATPSFQTPSKGAAVQNSVMHTRYTSNFNHESSVPPHLAYEAPANLSPQTACLADLPADVRGKSQRHSNTLETYNTYDVNTLKQMLARSSSHTGEDLSELRRRSLDAKIEAGRVQELRKMFEKGFVSYCSHSYKDGYLYKKRTGFKTSWKLLWWTLLEDRLLYHRSRTAIKPKGTISLHDCSLRESPLQDRYFCFEIQSPKKTYHLTCSSKDEMMSWIEAIEKRLAVLAKATIQKEGFLTKLGKIRKNWKKRWCKSDGFYLSYYSKSTAASPKGVIDLRDAIVQICPEDEIGKHNCFKIITQERIFFLYAESSTEMYEWLESLHMSAGTNTGVEGDRVKSSPT